VPLCEKYEELKDLIERNGGRVIDQHECISYQIKPDNARDINFSNFYKGAIHSSKWIYESIKLGKLDNKDRYFLCINIDEKSRCLNINKTKKYTIIEGMKLYETVTNQKNIDVNSRQFWIRCQTTNILPERSADSMKRFWSNHAYKTLEEYLI